MMVLKLCTASLFSAFNLTTDNLMQHYIKSLQYGTIKFKTHYRSSKIRSRFVLALRSATLRSPVVKCEENLKYPTNEKEVYYCLCKLGTVLIEK